MRLQILAILVTALTIPCYSQRSTATIAGAVQDQNGSAIPDASITVRNTATGVEREAVSNEEGFYTITALPAGPVFPDGDSSGFSDLLDTVGGASGRSTGHGERQPFRWAL